MAHGKHSGTGLYITVAIILAVITYIEYAIVEFPPTWMSSGWVLFWVILMSIVKFWMVIWFFMHLRDDPKIYTGFFSSGMVIGVGTFVVLIAMFILPRAVAPVMVDDVRVADVSGAPYGDPGLSAEQRALIETDGASRSLAQRAQAPRPRDGSLVVTPPAANGDGFALRLQAEPADEVADDVAEAVEEELADDPLLEDLPDTVSFDVELGATTYATCVGCHQADGTGIAGVFPPLAGHTPDLFLAEGGRSYLINVMLYGLQGQIVVDGTTYNGVMPAFPQLGDDAIAAVLNHIVTQWSNAERVGPFDVITAAEVEAERGQGLSPAQMLERRQDLVFVDDAAEPATDVATDATAEEADAEVEAEEAEVEPEPAADATPAADPTFDTALGASTYTNCVGCHQPNGAGIPGVFPPLAGHAADLYNADGGRTYLIETMLYGLQGQIVVDGTTYNGVMPAFAHLSDEAIAAVINHSVTEWGNDALIEDFDAIRAAEVADARNQGLAPRDMLERRSALGLD